jgi:hypothetical protein
MQKNKRRMLVAVIVGLSHIQNGPAVTDELTADLPDRVAGSIRMRLVGRGDPPRPEAERVRRLAPKINNGAKVCR